MGNLSRQQQRLIANGDPITLSAALSGLVPAKQVGIAVPKGVGGSPFTYVNTGQFTQAVVISGGTVSAITVSAGSVTGLTAGQFLLRPGDAVTVTYSVAPTVFNAVDLE